MSTPPLQAGPKGGQYYVVNGKKVYVGRRKRAAAVKRGGALTQFTKSQLSTFLDQMTEATRQYVAQQMEIDADVRELLNQWEKDTYKLLKGLSEHGQDEQFEYPE